ncbi:DUF5304 domain-containing protein [Streptomyces sp. NPDC094034]|uniref:DUF5304 domain-containing protein n=1 Tax=Streptomyces sp. NPDC094034 TaxID=3155309 RepID=UPI00331F415C
MSDATERPAADSDAWATACAEDLEAEKARRRATYGPRPGSATEELRKLVDAVADKVSALPGPLFGVAAQGAVQQFINQAKAAVEPVIERNPGVFDHLAAAGNELLAAYRSAVESQEARWTQGTPPSTGAAARETEKAGDPTDPRDEGPGPDGRIDLD